MRAPALTAQHLDVLAERSSDAVLLEVGWTELEDSERQLVERLLREALQPAT